jgi:hypothetical protein
VGQRVALLLAKAGGVVRVGSRQLERAAQVCAQLKARIAEAKVEPLASSSPPALADARADCSLVVSAGAAGVLLLPQSARSACRSLRMLIDLNAVPPLGIEGVEVADKGKERDGVICYGAIGVGDTKMKVHKAAIARLFEDNGLVLDIEEIYAIAQGLD